MPPLKEWRASRIHMFELSLSLSPPLERESFSLPVDWRAWPLRNPCELLIDTV